jgi:hypothetical protein
VLLCVVVVCGVCVYLWGGERDGGVLLCLWGLFVCVCVCMLGGGRVEYEGGNEYLPGNPSVIYTYIYIYTFMYVCVRMHKTNNEENKTNL